MRRTALALLLGAALAAPASAAEVRASALGSDGTLYRALSGSYRELFPHGHDLPRETPVLALDITRGATSARQLVPGSSGEDLERSAALVVEDSTQQVFLLWESQYSLIFSRVFLARWSGSSWDGAPIELSGNAFAAKRDFQVAVTRDHFVAPGAGTGTERTIVHLLWNEGDAGDLTMYAPVVLLDGSYIGWNPVFPLGDFDPHGPGSPGGTVEPKLVRADEDELVLGFSNPATGRLLTLSLRIEPAELRFLADDVAAYVRTSGVTPTAENVAHLGADARAHIINVGSAFHPSIRDYLASEVAARLQATFAGQPDATLDFLADDARAHIINVGIAALRDPLLRQAGNPAAVAELAANGSPDAFLVLDFRRVLDRATPATPAVAAGARATLLVAPSGQKALLAWELADRFVYRESTGDGWAPLQALSFGTDLDRDAALAVLAARVAN